jgi:hypothetical protein
MISKLTVWLASAAVLSFAMLPLLMPSLCSAIPRNDEGHNLRSLFYPGGMPTKPGWDGVSRQVVFEQHADVEVLPGSRAIIYSERTITGAFDDQYSVYLAVIDESGEGARIDSILEVTDRIPVYLEIPGNFANMTAELSQVPGVAGSPGLLLSISAVLSGSGGHCGTLDIVYRFDRVQRSLNPVLTLSEPSAFGKMGYGRYTANRIELYSGNVDGDSEVEIIASRRHSKSEDEIKQADAEVTLIELYDYVEGAYVRSTVIPALPETAARVKQASCFFP